MAELVAGPFLSSFFQVIFDKLASSNFTDYFHKGKLEELVEKLESTLDSINQVLDDAEIKQYQVPKVKKWLGDVKHAMYEVDQLLDEIATDAPLKKLKTESQPSTSNIFNFIPTFTNPFESRIKELLTSLDSLSERKDVLELKHETCVGKEVRVSSKPLERLPTSNLVDASGIYGRDGDKGEMIKTLLSNNGSSNQTPIISIVGLGGIGKTTLAKLVYNDKEIAESFKLKAWVYVSESFDVVGLTKAILKSFNSSADGEDLNLLQHQLQHILTGKKYLLVLDDIWNGDAECWEQLLLPLNHGSSGSKIIVTTREKAVAYHVLKSTKLFDLQQLDKINCWSLFVTHAFQGKSVCEHPNLESIGRKIVNKCGGLPLAIKSLGQLLRKKFSQDEWIQISETDMWRLSDRDHIINSVLRLSYHNLPSDLKRCFAYCSIFPKGYRFEKEVLIKLWMAEGLLKCCGSDKSEEEFGNEIFCDFESISFFQQSFDPYDTYEHYVMHDLVNDLTKSVSGEFCIQIEDVKVERSLERTRHIWCSLQSNCVDVKSLIPVCELTGLRSLILQGCWGVSISKNVQRDLFSGLKYLRMLKVIRCGLSELVDEISNLKLLRYLDLSYTEITSLPDSICMLYNLQTLLLQGCRELTELPSNFSKLVNLRHLELPSDYRGTGIKKMPKDMGKLSSLQSLSYFIVEEQNGSDLKELAKLNHFHGTLDIQGLGNVSDLADAATINLKNKKYLEELHMKFDGRREESDESMAESNVLVLEALQPNSNLNRLTISQYKGNSFPNWINGCHLPNLVSLELQDCGYSHWPPLEQLPSLKELFISNCNGIKIIGEEFYDNSSTNVSFRSLEVLEFRQMNNWEKWFCLEGLPLLKKLSITYCPKLKKALLPQHLPSLQQLFIHDCNKLEASIPKGDSIIDLFIERCDGILVTELPTSLKKFVLHENRYTEFSVEQILVNNTILEMLKLDFSGCVNCPSLSLCCYDSLETLSITGWGSSSLPLELHLFTKLQSLFLYDCPELESFPMGGLPSNLRQLLIENCPKLIASREEWGLFQLNSLGYFFVSDEFEKVESFPEENLLPPTLYLLTLNNCSKLRKMNNKGFLHLKSLRNIWINNCPSLESLPEKEALPNSLHQLAIKNCPIIKEKYEKEGGEHWHTISHIPNVSIDNIEQK